MKKILPLTLIAAALAPMAQADGVAVEPGLWEMTTVMTMPMLPQPQTVTTTDCVEDAVLDIDEMGSDEMDPDCTLDVSQTDDTTVRWTMDCPVEGGGSSHAEWQVTSSGDSVDGTGSIRMSVMGQEMSMDATFNGRRVGDCPAE
ncbi:MAG: DUF3617 family protein [Xanthomonadales bacterium]